MAKYLSNRHKNLKVGIISYTESSTVLEVTGKVGIGTTNAQYPLDVTGDINLTGTFRQNGSPFVASRWTAGTGDDIYRLDGDVGIGTTNPTSKLHVIGDANISGIVSATAFYGNGANLTDLINNISVSKIDGLTIKDDGDIVGTAGSITTLDFKGAGITASSGIATITVSGSTRTVNTYTATENQTTFSATYDIGYVDVYLNGSKLSQSQFTATNGTSVVLIEGASLNDVVEIVSYNLLLIDEQFDNLIVSGISTLGTSNGIGTVTVGVGTTALLVQGNARVTGTLFVGEGTITLDPNANTVSIGTAITLNANTGTIEVQGNQLSDVGGNANYTGIVTASSFVGNLTGTATTVTNIPNLTGDVTSNNTTTTLASVNNNVGTFGSSTAIPSITVNAKGLVTGVTTNAITVGDGTLTLATSGIGLSGSQTFSANQSGNATFTVTSNATSENTGGSIVSRDGAGGFSAGIITATLSGNASSATYATSAGIATYASTAGIATYSSIAGVSTYSSTAGIATYASTAGVSTYSSTAGVSTYSSTAGVSTYSSTAGIATYSSTAGVSTYSSTAGVSTYSSTAGVSTVAQNLTGSPSITVGTITAVDASFSGNASFAGVITATTGNFIGIITSSNANISGIVTATSFSGSGASLTSLDAGNISTGTLAIARGGTNSTATPTNGGIAYGTGTAFAFTAAGNSGQVLTSNGAGAPTWQAAAVSGVGIATAGGTVGTGATTLDFRGAGISTVTVSAGIATINITGGGGGGGLTISDDTSTNATRYVIFDDATSGSVSAANVSSTKLTFNPSTGNLSATQFTSLSDISQKKNVHPIENPIELTKQLQGVRFDWIDNDKPSLGLIAQDVEKVLPELVETGEDGLKRVNYSNMIGLLIETVKEQQVRIEELERKLNA